jgi:hypothetical protein
MSLESILINIGFQLERIADSLQTPMKTPTATVEREITNRRGKAHLGRPKGLIPKCGRCRREGRQISPKRGGCCMECEHEAWWTE